MQKSRLEKWWSDVPGSGEKAGQPAENSPKRLEAGFSGLLALGCELLDLARKCVCVAFLLARRLDSYAATTIRQGRQDAAKFLRYSELGAWGVMADQEPADKPGESDADGDLVAAAAAPSDEVDGKTLSATNGPASGDATTGSSSIKGKAVVQKVQAKRASQNSSEGEDDSANEEKYAKERQDKLATGKDFYCWNCHKEKANVSCTHCPRSYHFKCLTSSLTKGQTKDWEKAPADWTCLECRAIAKADEAMLVSPTLSKVSEDDFCTLLKFALQTIKQVRSASFSHGFLTYLFNSLDRARLVPSTRRRSRLSRVQRFHRPSYGLSDH